MRRRTTAYGERVARRWGTFSKSVTFDRPAYVRLVAATEELTKERDGDKRTRGNARRWTRFGRRVRDGAVGGVGFVRVPVVLPGRVLDEDMDGPPSAKRPDCVRRCCARIAENADMGVRELIARALESTNIMGIA